MRATDRFCLPFAIKNKKTKTKEFPQLSDATFLSGINGKNGFI